MRHAFVTVRFVKLPLEHTILSKVPVDAFIVLLLTFTDVIMDDGGAIDVYMYCY